MKMTRQPSRRFLQALVAAPLAAAQPTAAADWQFEATPYLFASGLEGDVKIGRIPAAGVEVGFSDIAKSLDLGFMAALEGRKGDAGFLADFIYFKASQGGGTPGALYGDASADLTQQLFSLAATWRTPGSGLDVLAGVRNLRIKADLQLTSGALSGRRANDSRNITDGFAGARIQASMGERWSFVGYADIGTGSSDLSYQLLAGVNYASSKDLTWKAGYRFMSIDYAKDAFVYDMGYGGPYLAVGFRF
jgi:hypothetical protein